MNRKRVLSSVMLRLETVRSAAIVTARALQDQNAEYDLDAAEVLIRCVAEVLTDQIDVLTGLIDALEQVTGEHPVNHEGVGKGQAEVSDAANQ